MLQWLVYYLRWLISALVMLPFMLYFERKKFPLWKNLIIGQTIGALIFYFVDKWIFTL
jgi:4-hydroxybenzoate polyprenyltransferase